MNKEELRIKKLEQEVSRLKNRYEQQESAAERYRTVFEDSLLGNKIISPELKILQVNQALVELMGFNDKSELIGHEIMEFAHPDHVHDWRHLQQKLWQQQIPSFQLETCLVRKDGHSIWVKVISSLFKDGGGLLGYTIIDDISGRRAGLERLHLSEQHFKLITDVMPQQVWTADADGKVNFLNEQIYNYTGLKPGALLNDGWIEIVHPDDREHSLAAYRDALSTGQDYRCEYRLLNKEGNYRWFISHGIPVYEDNVIVMWLGTNTDIQERKEREQQKDEFLSIASHELKTPLTSVKLFNQLAMKATDAGRREDFIRRETAHIQRLERLISDLLDVSKINAGKMTYDIKPFDFSQMIDETVHSLQPVSNSHRLVVESNEPVQVTGDRHRLEQVLNNLLLNAVKYSPGTEKVVIRTQVVGDTVITSVKDYGIGIATENISRLFDRYYRVDNTAMRFEGLGLGLYISNEILKRHNGSLWIESEPGAGSTFSFILPLNGRALLKDIDTDGSTFYTGNFITIVYAPEKHRLEVDWLGYQNLDSVKKGCMIMLDLLVKNNCSEVLNDNSKVMGNWSEAADWGAEFWFPAMAAAGLKRFAWIYSPSVFSRLSANKSVDQHPAEFEVRFFGDRDAAADWLDSR